MVKEKDEELPVGEVVGRYVIESTIGVGGMGAVYEAEQPELNRKVALKILLSKIATNEEARARFLQEGRVAANLHHPNVVEIFDVGIHEDRPYMVMERLVGQSLGEWLVMQPSEVKPEVAVDLLLPVVAALDLAHQDGILHRDLKPDNIFLHKTRHGVVQPKLLDFGISKALNAEGNSQLTMEASVLGTPHYLSPEQALGRKDLDGRSDQYAFGVVLYELLTRLLPCREEETLPLLHAVARGDIVPLDQARQGLPEGLYTLVERLLSKDKEHRYESMAELGHALLPFASSRGRAIWSDVFGEPGHASVRPESVAPERGVRLEGEPTSAVALPDHQDGTDGAARRTTPTTTGMTAAEEDEELAPLPLSSPSWMVYAGAAGVVLVAVVLGAVAFGGSSEEEEEEVYVASNASAPALRAGPPASLRIRVDPPGAAIFVDDERVGIGSAEVEAAAPFELRVEADGYAPFEDTVEDTEEISSPIRLVAYGVDLPDVTPPQGDEDAEPAAPRRPARAEPPTTTTRVARPSPAPMEASREAPAPVTMEASREAPAPVTMAAPTPPATRPEPAAAPAMAAPTPAPAVSPPPAPVMQQPIVPPTPMGTPILD